MTENQEIETLDQVIDKAALKEKELRDLFNKTVIDFKLRWINKGSPISQSGLWNYAMSVMRYEFHKVFDEETSKQLVDFYKP